MRKQLFILLNFLALPFLPGQPHEQMGQFRRCEVGMMQGRNRGQLHDVAANDSGLGRNPLQNEMRFFPDQAAGRGSAGCGHQGRVKRIDIEAQIDIL